MAWSPLQYAVQQQGLATAAYTTGTGFWGNPLTPGSSCFIYVWSKSSLINPVITDIRDSLGNIYTQAISNTVTTAPVWTRSGIWFCHNVIGGSSPTITVLLEGVVADVEFGGTEVSGLPPDPPYATATQSQPTALSATGDAGTIVPQSAGDFAVVVVLTPSIPTFNSPNFITDTLIRLLQSDNVVGLSGAAGSADPTGSFTGSTFSIFSAASNYGGCVAAWGLGVAGSVGAASGSGIAQGVSSGASVGVGTAGGGAVAVGAGSRGVSSQGVALGVADVTGVGLATEGSVGTAPGGAMVEAFASPSSPAQGVALGAADVAGVGQATRSSVGSITGFAVVHAWGRSLAGSRGIVKQVTPVIGYSTGGTLSAGSAIGSSVVRGVGRSRVGSRGIVKQVTGVRGYSTGGRGAVGTIGGAAIVLGYAGGILPPRFCGTLTDAGKIEILNFLRPVFGGWSVMLMSSLNTPTQQSSLAGVVETTFPGYRRLPITNVGAARLDEYGHAVMFADAVMWTNTGRFNASIAGWGYIRPLAFRPLRSSCVFSPPIVIPPGGSLALIPRLDDTSFC